jgi:hypothetical protein
METATWFENLPVIGQMQEEQAAQKLREIGEEEAATLLEQVEETAPRRFGSGERKHPWPFQDKPWQYTAHTFGYLAPNSPGEAVQAIRHIEEIAADSALRGERIKLTLNRLRIAAYPGRGTHRVLLHLCAQNQTPRRTESVHFSTTYRVLEGQSAGVQGYPLFTGLYVGQEGLSVKCRTINVRNDQDEAFLSVLESEPFRTGVQLVTTAQPMLASFSALTLGLAKMIATRHRNVSVQDFDLGLDFSTIPLRGRLAEGAYLAVQIPESFHAVWDWDEWVYLPHQGLVARRDDHQQLIPYNYLIFGLSRADDGHGRP